MVLFASMFRAWAQACQSLPRLGLPEEQCRQRHLQRKMEIIGYEQDRVHYLAASICYNLLELSVLLFFIDLITFLANVNTATCVVVSSVVLAGLSFYLFFGAWPAWNPELPYQSILSSLILSCIRRYQKVHLALRNVTHRSTTAVFSATISTTVATSRHLNPRREEYYDPAQKQGVETSNPM